MLHLQAFHWLCMSFKEYHVCFQVKTVLHILPNFEEPLRHLLLFRLFLLYFLFVITFQLVQTLNFQNTISLG